jgi:hypothetical protein
MKYLIRSIKYLLYFAILFCIIVLIVFYTSNNHANITVFDLFKEGSGIKILIFFIAVAALYPLLGFSKKELYTNDDFKEKKKEVVELFENARYILKSDDGSSMVFVLRSPIMRTFRMYEDDVTVNYSGNPLIISGLRKDVLRFSRAIEYLMQKES